MAERLRMTITVEYDADRASYVDPDITPAEMARIDQDTAAEDPALWLDDLPNGQPVKVAVEPIDPA
jgi:hypothetical protein